MNDREYQISSWSPIDGYRWEATLSEGWSEEVTYTGLDGGRALNLGLLTDQATATEAVRWQVTGPDGTEQGELDPDWWMIRPGPMLHPEGPAFMISASHVEDKYSSQLHVLTGGKTVWSIDAFKIGLDQRRFWLAELVKLTE